MGVAGDWALMFTVTAQKSKAAGENNVIYGCNSSGSTPVAVASMKQSLKDNRL